LTDILLRCKNEVEAVRNYFRHKPVRWLCGTPTLRVA
jgi:hypothetical protein